MLCRRDGGGIAIQTVPSDREACLLLQKQYIMSRIDYEVGKDS